MKHDLLVIGGGPAGYAAALYGASAGLNVGLVEKDALGGTCLNVGCIPAKEFLESANIYQTVLKAKEFGTEIQGTPSLNMAEVQARKQQIVTKLTTGLAATIKGRGIEVYSGVGSLINRSSPNNKPSTINRSITGAGRVLVSNPESGEEQEIEASHILLAAGSKPKELPSSTGLKVDGKNVVTSDEILSWEEIPESVAIVGAGAIGAEFASFFVDIGTKVLLLEALDSILMGVDKDIRRVVEKSFTKRGVEIETGVSISGYEDGLLIYAGKVSQGESNRDSKEEASKKDSKKASKKASKKDSKKEFKTDLVVVCVGRRPYTDLLGLDKTEVELDSAGFIKTDENLETNLKGVYAAGDIIDTPQLAHTGFAEGIFVVQHLLGEEPTPIDYEKVPWGIYCQPEVAFAGLSEEAAKEAGYEVVVSKHSFVGNGRAQILGETQGMVKVVAEKVTKSGGEKDTESGGESGTKGGRLLGVHMAGHLVTEQLGAGYLAINWDATAEDVAKFVFPHPTLSEMFSEAAISLTGRSLHA